MTIKPNIERKKISELHQAEYNSWGNWFSGFVDAEGCFSASILKDKRHNSEAFSVEFSICLRDDDSKIIKDLVDIFNLQARIHYIGAYKTTKPTIRLRVRGFKNCEKIVDIFKQFPLKSKKNDDFLIWCKIIELGHNKKENDLEIRKLIKDLVQIRKYKSETSREDCNIETLNDSFCNWFAGLSAGDGSFSFSCSIDNRNNRPIISPRFSLRLRDDDYKTINMINKTFDFKMKLTATSKNKTSNPTIGIDIRKLALCERIIEIFEKFPLKNKKEVDFIKWKTIINEIKNFPSPNAHKARDLSKTIEMIKTFQEERKYGN